MFSRYTIHTEGDEALGASTPETILLLTAPASVVFRLVEYGVSFDGVTAANSPVLVELVYGDAAETGTGSGATEQQVEGSARAAAVVGEHSFSVEPTVLVVLKPFFVDPNKGILIVQNPLIREYQRNITTRVLGIRCTAPDAVNVRGYMEWEEE